jgi:LysM repeat protein
LPDIVVPVTAAVSFGNPVSHTDTLDYIIHKVRKGETVYSIAKDYLIGVEDIYLLNPESKQGIRKKQKLKIPLMSVTIPVEADTGKQVIKKPIGDEGVFIDHKFFCDSLMYDEEYSIAVMIPFYLDEVDSIKVYDDSEIMPPDFYKSFRFLPFYQGLLMALDSLEKHGLKAKVYVFDITSDTNKTNRILEDTAMKNLDMIIGLIYLQLMRRYIP